VFGRALHVAGTDRAALESAIRAADGGGPEGDTLSGHRLSWQEVEPRLEDVFIHMLSVDQDRRPSP